MVETIIKFIDEDVDGCGTDVVNFARAYGGDVSVGTIDRIKEAIENYKRENEGEWDTDGCLEAATEQLEAEGFEVHWINPNIEICF